MNKEVLVPMKRDDRVEDFITYVENVARPGMKVVFMIPYRVDGLRGCTKGLGPRFGSVKIEDALSLLRDTISSGEIDPPGIKRKSPHHGPAHAGFLI